jgi:predicted SprT family Zn-dependent metalloprotease
MNLLEAQILTLDLMRTHGLTDVGFAWHQKACVFGDYIERTVRGTGVVVSRTIRLSKRLTRTNSVDVVKDVILHEIAHALAGHSAAHGPTWKSMCLRVGAVPEPCKALDFTTVHPPTGGYSAQCKLCGAKRWRARRPTKSYSCGSCGIPGQFDPSRVFVWEKRS